MSSDYIYTNEGLISVNELMHYGVPGMRWGHRRYYNANGTLNAKGVKKYAKKQYAKEALKSNKSILGKTYDRFTGAHKIQADLREHDSSKRQNEAAAKKYLEEKKKSSKNKSKNAKEAAAKGAVKTAKIMATIGTASLADDIFYGGAGKKAVNSLIKYGGRAVVTAAAKARGATNIHWHD